MPKVLTKDIVLRRLASRGITIVGEYLGGKAKTRFQCKEGHAWDAQPRNVMHGTGCPHCSGTLRLTRELVNERLVGRELTMTGPYVNALTKTEFTCANRHTWEAQPGSVMYGNRYPICAVNFPLTKKLVNERIEDRSLLITDDYYSTSTHTEFTCSEDHSWEATSLNVMLGTGRKSRLPRVTDKKRIKNNAQWELPL